MKLTVLGAAKPAQSSSADVAELGQGQPRTSNIANQQHRPVAGHGIMLRQLRLLHNRRGLLF